MNFQSLISLLLIQVLLSLSVEANSESLSPALKEFERYLFENNESGVRRGRRTEGVLLVHDGKTIYEKYARGYGPDKQHIMWSASKTVMALLYGVAIREGRVRLSQSVCDFDQFPRPEQCAIRIEDLLTWSSGIHWREEYEKSSSPRKSSVLAMLYGQGFKDMARFVMAQPLERHLRPGEVWRYSSGDSELATAILGQIFKGLDLRAVFREKLFDPLGVSHWTWENDNAQTLGGAYYFYTTTRDMARVGELFVSNGSYGGRVIVPSTFIDFMKTVPSAFKAKRLDADGSNISGAHLWVNRPEGTNLNKPWPNAPVDTVVAMGHWGQYLVVIPSLKWVAVRIGDTRDKSITAAEFVDNVMSVVRGHSK